MTSTNTLADDIRNAKQCQVCGERSEKISLHYGAATCQACKKFFWRSRNPECNQKYTCESLTPCIITYISRNCQRCRYNKCLSIGMDISIKSSQTLVKPTSIQCSVCKQPANGIHFGVVSCEGCKGFFRRSQVHEKAKTYTCNQQESPCPITLFNSCRYCRYAKCIEAGMSYEGAKIGRRSNLVKRELALIKSDRIEAAVTLIDNPPAKRMRYQFVEQSQNDYQSVVTNNQAYDFNKFNLGYHETVNHGQVYSGFDYNNRGYEGFNWGTSSSVNSMSTNRVTGVYHQTSGHWMPSTFQYY